MENITLKPTEGRDYKMVWNEVIELGEAALDIDGFYYFLPNKNNGGLWHSHVLKAIAEKLDDLNKEWDENISKYFDEAANSQFTDEELDDLPF
jgi:hypothetical protein